MKIVYEVEIQTLKKFGLNKYEETQIGLSKKRIDKYERMEKSKFYFQQEEIELEKMAFEMNGGQKEIENCLRNERMIMEKTGPAGTKQILMAILRNLKTSNNFQGYMTIYK